MGNSSATVAKQELSVEDLAEDIFGSVRTQDGPLTEKQVEALKKRTMGVLDLQRRTYEKTKSSLEAEAEELEKKVQEVESEGNCHRDCCMFFSLAFLAVIALVVFPLGLAIHHDNIGVLNPDGTLALGDRLFLQKLARYGHLKHLHLSGEAVVPPDVKQAIQKEAVDRVTKVFRGEYEAQLKKEVDQFRTAYQAQAARSCEKEKTDVEARTRREVVKSNERRAMFERCIARECLIHSDSTIRLCMTECIKNHLDIGRL